jgi:hypothetical protein
MKLRSPIRLRRWILWVLIATGIILLLSVVWDAQRDVNTITGKTNEQRVEYLRSLGWEVSEVPLREQVIRLPKEFPDVLKKYNELQIQQGFDMIRYAGKEVTMYTYAVQKGEDSTQRQAVLYVYKNKVIGGDVHSPAFDGEMEPLR